MGEREHWRQRLARVLETLVTHHSHRGEHQQGLGIAQRLLALEPWREEILPPDVVAVAQERGRARDLDATVVELLTELGER